MNYLIILIGLLFSISLPGQSMAKLTLDNSSLNISEITNMNSYGNFGAIQGNLICGLNVINRDVDLVEMLLLSNLNIRDFKSGLIIYHKEGSLVLKKVISRSVDEVFILGSFNKPGSANLMMMGILNLKIKKLYDFKIVSLTTDPNFVLNPIDVIYLNNQFYIVAESIVPYLNNFHNKIVILKYDGTTILWANIYNSLAPIYSETPQSINFDPNGNLLISGLIHYFDESYDKMMLAQVDHNGEPMQLKRIELLNADMSYSHRYGWTYVKSKGYNIHLFSQSVVGRSETGPVLITMFDTLLQLRTWRDYSVPIRVESAIIEGNFFLFGGQAPVELGSEGYNLMKVNSSNAIVEQFKNYTKELKNSSMATSSASSYDRNVDKIWTLVRPNGFTNNFLILLENNSTFDHLCSGNLNSNVAKDPMDVSDVIFNAKSIQLQLSDIDCYLKEVTYTSEEVCYTTNVKTIGGFNINVYPNPSSGSFNITSEKTLKFIEIMDNQGRVCSYSNMNSTYKHFNLTLHPGLYYMRIGQGSTIAIKKLVIY